MTTRFVTITLAVAAVGVGSARAGDRLNRATVVFDGHLLVVDDNGRVDAWDVATGEYAKDRAARLSRGGMTALATDGKTLWSADGACTLSRWVANKQNWERAADYEAGGGAEPILAVVGGTPLVVFPSRVVDPLAGKTFPVPKLPGYAELLGWPPRILSVHGTGTTVWIGTGKGEWGGSLLGLDPKTGRWVSRVEGGGYVTGITHTADDTVVVSWSMSHFSASTSVVVHGADALPMTTHPTLSDKYYQRLAYNRFDETLYGVESATLVSIRDGRPTVLAKLNGDVFVREPHAMGVAPGLLAVVPLDTGSIAVIPKWGLPWRLRDGTLNRLTIP